MATTTTTTGKEFLRIVVSKKAVDIFARQTTRSFCIFNLFLLPDLICLIQQYFQGLYELRVNNCNQLLNHVLFRLKRFYFLKQCFCLPNAQIIWTRIYGVLIEESIFSDIAEWTLFASFKTFINWMCNLIMSTLLNADRLDEFLRRDAHKLYTLEKVYCFISFFERVLNPVMKLYLSANYSMNEEVSKLQLCWDNFVKWFERDRDMLPYCSFRRLLLDHLINE